MTSKFCFGICLCVYSISLCAQTPAREIAITIDDLPAAGIGVAGSETLDMTAKFLGTLRDQKVPAVGFVNERKLYRQFGEVDQRIKALSMWLDYGFELGNHTYSHASLSRVPLKEWEEEVILGETVTTLLLS